MKGQHIRTQTDLADAFANIDLGGSGGLQLTGFGCRVGDTQMATPKWTLKSGFRIFLQDFADFCRILMIFFFFCIFSQDFEDFCRFVQISSNWAGVSHCAWFLTLGFADLADFC